MLTEIASKKRSEAYDSFGIGPSESTNDSHGSNWTTSANQETKKILSHKVENQKMSGNRQRKSQDESLDCSYP